MGELPPLHTPQGPDVPRALRPRFPRVDSSGTSRVPSSRSASFPFLASSSLHFAHLLSQGSRPPFRVLRFLPLPSLSLRPGLSGSLHFAHLLSSGESPPLSRSPLPSPSFPFLASSSLRFSPRSDTGSSTDLSALVPSCFPPLPSPSFPFLASSSLRFSPLRSPHRFLLLPSPSFPFLASSSLRFSPLSSARISSGWFLCLGCVFPFFPLPCVQFFPVRLRFPQLPLSFLLLPSPSFPFLSSSSLRFSPLSSASFSRRLPAH